MSKRMTRVLSLILTLVMFVSVSTPAFAWGGGDLGSGWDREIGEDEVREFDGPVVEDEEALDYFHTIDNETLLEVTVEAPMGALPMQAELRAEPVEIEDVREAVESVVEGEANIVLAMDISFWMNGIEIEPEQPVSVKISAPELADKTNLTLVHIPDAAEPETIELIDDEDLGFALGTTEIAFKANSFSVYVIVDGEPDPPVTETYRRTYKFTTDGTTPFEFYNKAGMKVTEQIVKTGDTLEAVTLPYAASHTFQNWVVSASDDQFVKVDDEVNLPLEITDDINANEKDTTVTLKPAYGNVFYVTFHAADLPADPDIIQTKKIVVEGEKVVIGDVQAPAPNETHIFYGWTADSAGSADNAVVVYDEDNKLIADKEYPETGAITADVDLYPYFVEAYWLRFVSGETGSRASYVPAQFALATQTLTDLPVPTRIGYNFDGWYTGSQSESGKITYNDQVTDSTGKVINPASGLKLTEETVLYGHWTAKNDSSYKVVIWRQKVTDDKNATDSEKTYDYAESAIRTGMTEAAAEPSSADMSKSGGDYTGFHYARTEQNKATIDADGSTVVNVYYDRDLIAFNFYYRSGHAPSGSPTAYTYSATTGTGGTQYGVLPDGTYVELERISVPVTTYNWYYHDRFGSTYPISSNYCDGIFYILQGSNYVASGYTASNPPASSDQTAYFAYDTYDRAYYSLTAEESTETEYQWQYTVDGTTYTYTGTRYTRSTMNTYTNMVTYTGLWGQNFDKYSYTWPSTYEWNESSNGWGTTQTFLTGFVQKDNNGNVKNPYNLYDQNTPGTETIYHYKQGLDGLYHTADRSTAKSSGGTFTFSNKFEGFTVDTYGNSFNENGGSTSAIGNDGKPKTGVSLSDPAHIYHKRNQWTITYQATASAQSTQFETVATSEKIYFEAPLGTKSESGEVTSKYDLNREEAGLPVRDGYTFSGWYADETCTTKFDFSGEMPNANVTVYAGWEPVWYSIWIDPDGGIITPDIGSTYMWKQHGTEEKLGRYEVVRPYIEDPNGNFGYVYVDGYDDPDGIIKVRTATYENWTEGMGKKYRPINPAVDPTYTLVGWYDVDFETGETTSTPHDFDAEITGPIWIRAVWNLGGDYGLVYNATAQVTVKEGQDPVTVSGTFTQADPEARYADGAEFVVDVPPTNVTNGFVFDGWEIVEPNVGDTQGDVLDDNGGKYYQPGETITLDAAAWSRSKTVYLRAHFTPVEGSDQPIGVTYLQFKPNFPADAKVTNGEETDVKYYPLNTAIELANDEFVPTDYTAGGYKLIGWSQNKDAEPVVHAEGAGLGEIVFGLKDTIGVDAITPTEKATFVKDDGEEIEVDCNVLYAIWAPLYFYVYHSSDNTVEKIQMPVNEDGTFDLTSKVASGFLYGGYYSDYGKKGDYDIENPAEFTSAVSNSTAYVGGIGPWKAANAIKTAKGTEMIPEVDKTYFLKEVPSVFLKSLLYVIYDAKNVTTPNLIVHNYLIADVDDNNYNDIGLFATNISTGSRIKLATSYSIVDSFNGKTDKINAATFGATKGYVAVWKPDLATKDFDLVPYFVTPDGVTVEGAKVRSITWGDGTYKEWAAPGVTFSDADNENIIVPGQVQKAARS